MPEWSIVMVMLLSAVVAGIVRGMCRRLIVGQVQVR
jgi:hypothetical protein